MERSQRPYSIYKRRSKKKKSEYYFYVRFRAEDSRYLPAVASHQTSRAAAANWADAELAKGHIITPGKRGALFGTFADCFWNYDGDYITRRLARGGHFSRSFAVTPRGLSALQSIPNYAAFYSRQRFGFSSDPVPFKHCGRERGLRSPRHFWE